MAYEGFVDYWAASIKRCPEALDAKIGSRGTPERAEIAKLILAKVEALRRAERFMEGYDDPWAPTGRYGGKLVDWMVQARAGVKTARLATMYGTSPIEQILVDPLFKRINPEGEKQMEKIDWHKPLRAFKTPGHEVVDAKVYTYKSGRQRVVWVDDRVYPVDDQGRAVANVGYGLNWVQKGHQIVENVPEEKFFLGLSRGPNGTYGLTDGGVPTTMAMVAALREEVAQIYESEPHWIVDTRKSAEPPTPVKHDPKDYVVVYHGDEDETAACTNRLLTQKKAKALCGNTDTIVRVRTTPAPADTARYIHLWRTSASAPWLINKFGDGRQEFTTAEVGHRWGLPTKTCCIVKVRD